MTIPTCQQCGGEMAKTTISNGNVTGIFFAIIVFCISVVLLISDDEAFNIIRMLIIVIIGVREQLFLILETIAL
jgi:hypothetical protein